MAAPPTPTTCAVALISCPSTSDSWTPSRLSDQSCTGLSPLDPGLLRWERPCLASPSGFPAGLPELRRRSARSTLELAPVATSAVLGPVARLVRGRRAPGGRGQHGCGRDRVVQRHADQPARLTPPAKDGARLGDWLRRLVVGDAHEHGAVRAEHGSHTYPGLGDEGHDRRGRSRRDKSRWLQVVPPACGTRIGPLAR